MKIFLVSREVSNQQAFNLMKKSLFTFIAACFTSAFLVGCGGEATVDTSKLQSQFASASGDAKAEVDKAITAINSGDMRGAVSSLGKVMTMSNDLSQAQLTAVEEAFVMANVVVLEQGDAQSAAESKANKSALQDQAQGSE
jgi:hypothetical protein